MNENTCNTVVCRTFTVAECAKMLGISRGTAYALVAEAEKTGTPFKVLKLGRTLRIPARSFNEYCQAVGAI